MFHVFPNQMKVPILWNPFTFLWIDRYKCVGERHMRQQVWILPPIRPRSLLSPLFPDFPLRHLTLMVHWTPTTPSYQELMLLSAISTFLIKLVFVTRTIQFKTNQTLWMNDVWKTSLTNLNPFFFDSNDLFAGSSSKWLGIKVYISACLSRSEFRLSGVGSAEF